MKTNEIEINEYYMAKISDNVVPVCILEEHPSGGWIGLNMMTDRKCRIKSARKLRQRATKAMLKAAEMEVTKARNTKSSEKALKRATANVGKNDATTNAKATKNATRANTANDKANETKTPKRIGLLTIAATILAKANQPMNCKAIVNEAMANHGWTTNGKTPHATLYAAIIREIANKGDNARFTKVDRGRFQTRKG